MIRFRGAYDVDEFVPPPCIPGASFPQEGLGDAGACLNENLEAASASQLLKHFFHVKDRNVLLLVTKSQTALEQCVALGLGTRTQRKKRKSE